MIYKLKKRCKYYILTSQSCYTTTLDKFYCIATSLKLQIEFKGGLQWEKVEIHIL